jgi:ubiquinone/menaquinone biosynthesis C-methylase UbiE
VTYYEQIGVGYAERRRPDPRIERRILEALGDARSVVNVGAGAGSYEPRDRRVVAVEPTSQMFRQRSHDAAPVVQAVAERLPFPDGSFDAALAVLTVHHWTDLEQGIGELRRVARRQVILGFDVHRQSDMWLVRDYIPAWAELEEAGGATVERTLALVRTGSGPRPISIPTCG